MHCPNCGKHTSSEQKFCRSCGLGLETFARLLGEQLEAEALAPPRPEAVALREKQRRVERWLGGAALTLVTLLVGLTLFAAVYGVIIRKGQWLQGSVFALLILAAAAGLGLVFYNESLKEKLAARPAPPPAPGEATAELLPEARFEPAQSVTERTTELLATERPGGRR